MLRKEELIQHTQHMRARKRDQFWTQFLNVYRRTDQMGARKLPVWLRALKRKPKERLHWQLLLVDQLLEMKSTRMENSATSTPAR